MPKKKSYKRTSFKPGLIAALAVFILIFFGSVFLAYSRGVGPLAGFLASPSINRIVEDPGPYTNTGTTSSGSSSSTSTTPVAKPYCDTECPSGQFCVKTLKGGFCKDEAVIAAPAPAAPAAPTTTVTSNTCGGGNIPVKEGQWVATGEDMTKYGGTSDQRRCVQCDCSSGVCKYSGSKACDVAYATDPTNTVLPQNAGYQYTSGSKTTTVLVPNACITPSGNVPSGSLYPDGKSICFNGKPIAVSTYNATTFKDGDAFCSANASTPVWDKKLSKCVAAPAVAQPPTTTTNDSKYAAPGTITSDSSRCEYYIVLSNSSYKCVGASTNGAIRGTEPPPVTAKSCSELGLGKGGCSSSQVCVYASGGTGPRSPDDRDKICISRTDIVSQPTTCSGNILAKWNPDLLKLEKTYCSAGCDGLVCRKLGEASANFATEAECNRNKPDNLHCVPAVGGRGGFMRSASAPAATTPQVDKPAESQSPARFDNEITGSTSDSTLSNNEWAGKECDGTAASKDSSGNYTSTPSCGQVCGGLGSHIVNGVRVCKEQALENEVPPADTPANNEWAGKECDGTAASKDSSGNYTSTPSCGQVCGGLGSHIVNGVRVCKDSISENNNALTSNLEIISNNTYQTLDIGEQCGPGFPSCEKCKGGVATEYQEGIGYNMDTFYKCGNSTEVKEILNRDRVDDSEQKIIKDNSTEQTLKIGDVCRDGILSNQATRCSKCPSGLSTEVKINGSNIKICGEPEEIEKLNLAIASNDINPPNSVVANTTIGGLTGCLAGAATYGGAAFLVGTLAAGIGSVITTPVGLISGCLIGAAGGATIGAAVTPTDISVTNITTLRKGGERCGHTIAGFIKVKDQNGDDLCESGICQFEEGIAENGVDIKRSGYYCAGDDSNQLQNLNYQEIYHPFSMTQVPAETSTAPIIPPTESMGKKTI